MSTQDYLARLGLDVGLPPTIETLRAVHEAHVEQVPYTNLDIVLGAVAGRRPPSVTPRDSLERIVATGRAGYCLHQNGALELVLHDIGFAVERRHGHVWTEPEHRDRTELSHLVLEVSGLPSTDNPGGRWWPDVGLGEGFFSPLALVDGPVDDGPLRFTLSEVTPRGWSFANDPSGSFTGLEVRPLPVDHDAVLVAHADLSTPPKGAFTRTLVVQRRTCTTQETLRGRSLTVVDAGGRHEQRLADYDAWRDAIAGLGLSVADVDGDDLRALWEWESP